MIKSRAKHLRGAREFSALCRQAGFAEASSTHGSIKTGGLPGLSVEVRRAQRLHLEHAMDAAAEAAGENIPVLAHRSDGQPWRITLGLEDFFRLYRAYLQTHPLDPKSPAGEAYHNPDPDSDHPLADDPVP